MRARPLATCVAILALLLSSLALLAPASAQAKPGGKRPKPTVAVALGAAEYAEGEQPVVTYSWGGLRKRDRLKLEYKTETGSWRFAQTLPKVTGRDGSATVAVEPVQLGEISYRFTVTYRKFPKRSSSKKTVSAETAEAKVFGAVPIEDIIRTYPASNADLRRGTVSVGGQPPFPFTFTKFFTGENVWRTLVSVTATSCKGWGIPLTTRYRGAATGGTFGMQVLGAGGALLYANSAAPETGTGLLFPSTVGSTITVQLRSDADLDYFGAGQAICYTDDGKL